MPSCRVARYSRRVSRLSCLSEQTIEIHRRAVGNIEANRNTRMCARSSQSSPSSTRQIFEEPLRRTGGRAGSACQSCRMCVHKPERCRTGAIIQLKNWFVIQKRPSRHLGNEVQFSVAAWCTEKLDEFGQTPKFKTSDAT